ALRAGGKKGDGDSDNQIFMEGEGQPGEPKLSLPGMGREGSGEGQGDQPGNQNGNQGQQPGDGIGNEHDPNIQGEATKLASKKREVKVDGREGQGPGRSEVIYGPANQGFSQQSYKRVYTDYTHVVEEVMSREQVPLGMRYYVKRYFNL